MAKLKPCPFCGEQPNVMNFGKGRTSIDCKSPNCFMTWARMVEDDNEMRRRWNTRAEEPAEEKTAHWDINVDGYYPFCSHCGEATQHMTRFCPNCGRKMITRGHEDT